MADERNLIDPTAGMEEAELQRYLKKKKIMKIAILVLVVICFAGMIYGAITQAPGAGEVTVTIEVRYSETLNPFAYFVHVPEGASLKEALLKTEMITLTEDGAAILSVEDITVNPNEGESWQITSREETLSTGLDDTLIHEDTHFELIFTAA